MYKPLKRYLLQSRRSSNTFIRAGRAAFARRRSLRRATSVYSYVVPGTRVPFFVLSAASPHAYWCNRSARWHHVPVKRTLFARSHAPAPPQVTNPRLAG